MSTKTILIKSVEWVEVQRFPLNMPAIQHESVHSVIYFDGDDRIEIGLSPKAREVIGVIEECAKGAAEEICRLHTELTDEADLKKSLETELKDLEIDHAQALRNWRDAEAKLVAIDHASFWTRIKWAFRGVRT